MTSTASNTVEKVTTFITRQTAHGVHLLLFQHPSAGIQLPAGTVEPGELPADAALREAREETSLTEFSAQHHLASAADPLTPDSAVVTGAAAVYERADVTSAPWAQLRRGIVVQVLRRQPGFAQVKLAMWNSLDDPQYITFDLTGWVTEEAITTARIRHYFHFPFCGPTQSTWVTYTDHHNFKLFWAPLNALPEIVAPQRTWLRFLAPVFPQLSDKAQGDGQ